MKESFFEVKAAVPAEDRASEHESVAEGAVERFVDHMRTFFDTYAGDASLEICSAEGVKTEDGPLDTCAIDLEHGKVYLHPRFLSETYGGSEAKMLFGSCHEIEHFRELRELLAELDGAQVWQAHQAKIAGKRRYRILDNSFDDVKMNRTVVSRAPTLAEPRRELYLSNLFPEKDLSTLPKHMQFAHILNCEQQETGETWNVHPDVREAMKKLQAMKGKSGVGFIDYASHPDTPMSVRLKLQEAVIEPIYEKFFVEDAEERKKASENKKGDGKPDDKPDGKPGEESDGKSDEKGTGEKGKDDGKPEGQPGDAEGEGNPEDFFKGEYDEYDKRFRRATPKEVIDKAVEGEIKRQQAEGGKDGKASEKAFEAYAAAQGVSAGDLRAYRRFLDDVERVSDPKTGERAIEELRELFERIISRRKRPMLAPKYPLPEGDLLAYPTEAVVRTRSGETEPDVWEDVEFREKDDKLAGDFDVTVVGDASGSMEGEKADAQRVAIALVLEALSEFSESLEARQKELAADLHVRTEGWVFGDGAECVKPLSEELSEKERVAMYKRLGKPDGNATRDFLALEKLADSLSDDERERLAAGKMKKIVIVMTDGESSDASRVRRVLEKLREAHVIVVGIGITEAGKPALATYAPEAQLCGRPEDLAAVLAELLKGHLENL